MKINLTGVVLLLAMGSLRAQIVSPNTNLTAHEEQIVEAAQPEVSPRFNGASVFGIRPGTPFLHALAVTGAAPMDFSVADLPDGLKFDAAKGIIAGSLVKAGEYFFTARAQNAEGTAETKLQIICGDRLALLPPMGWNSYDAFGDAVTEAQTMSNAMWLQKHLQPLGWDTVVVDFRWYDRLADGVRVQNPEGVTIDGFGRCIPPTNRFPDAVGDLGFKPLADKIHAMGLKFGIHIMRGIPRLAVAGNLPIADSSFTAAQAVRPESDTNRTCIWNQDMWGVDATTEAGKAWYASVARQYADWGVDYIKCDDITQMGRGEVYGAEEIEALSTSLRKSSRSIVLSLSPGPAPVNCGPHLKEFANLWRISGDFWDKWSSLDHNFELFAAWLPDAAPGHWPDGDMIPLGHICQNNCDVRPDRWTRFTRDEQLMLMSLWALAPSPLMLGMNLPDNDEWTTALLTNPEALAVNQDSLACAARRMTGWPVQGETWMKKLADGSFAVGLFNRSEKTVTVRFPWRNLGFLTAPQTRDLWRRSGLPKSEICVTELPPHGAALLKVTPSRD